MKSMRAWYFVIAICVAAALSGTERPAALADPGNVIVYGTSGCLYCKNMIKWLEESGVPYVFRNVENDAEFEEMSAVVTKANYRTHFYYPVMVISGRVVMRPSTDDVKKALAGERIKGMEQREYKDPSWRPGFPKSLKYSYEDISAKVKEGDVTVYDDNSPHGGKMMQELKSKGVPFTCVPVGAGTPELSRLRGKLDDAGFGSKTVLPAAEVRGQLIMDVRADDIILMLIESLGD